MPPKTKRQNFLPRIVPILSVYIRILSYVVINPDFAGKPIPGQPPKSLNTCTGAVSISLTYALSTIRMGQIAEKTYSPAFWTMMQYQYSAAPSPLELVVSHPPTLPKLLSVDMTYHINLYPVSVKIVGVKAILPDTAVPQPYALLVPDLVIII